MKASIRAALPIAALLAMAGCSSDSKDNCEKVCDKLVACATDLGTTVDVLLDQEGVTAANCASGCREMAATECYDAAGFFDCVEPLTCPATIVDAQDEIAVCQGYCIPPPPPPPM